MSINSLRCAEIFFLLLLLLRVVRKLEAQETFAEGKKREEKRKGGMEDNG